MIKDGIKVECESASDVVFSGIGKALINIAPEQEERFLNVHKVFTLKQVKTSKWILDVDTSKKLIRVSSSALDLLWVQCLRHFRFY